MSNYNQDKLTQVVVEAFAGTPDARLRELMTALVRHVHALGRAGEGQAFRQGDEVAQVAQFHRVYQGE